MSRARVSAQLGGDKGAYRRLGKKLLVELGSQVTLA